MDALPSTIINSSLWQSTLAERDGDDFSFERARLRSAFIEFRERVGLLANEIHKELPDLTLHDQTHLDALWEIGSTIVGSEYQITPAEGFVLGGAFLLHDLGMSLAAFEGGAAALMQGERWSDAVFSEYFESCGRYPTGDEVTAPNPEIRQRVIFNLLRELHAEQAERLALIGFATAAGSMIFLIENTELRQTLGPIIGKIAHSHWWSIVEIDANFPRSQGAPHWCPATWTIDPLKIACILRAADAAHLDARRAPIFLRTLSRITPASQDHWAFQEKLNKPYLKDDSLVFSNGALFGLSEASAWWLCLDALKLVDRELRDIDALLADKGQQRFCASRVAGVDLPDRLAKYIHTDGWLPINATIHVTDLPHIIRSLGGEELYGKSRSVVLRELIQNGADAVRARKVYESRDEGFGAVHVSIETDSEGQYWLEVRDTGIGMSQRVLTDFLLDFGKSFWGSSQMREEFPGLLSSGVQATGKYGIGFFSVFMASDHVKVSTRRCDAAARDTLVLEFKCGLNARPLLRKANRDEQLIDGGTSVRLQLKQNPYVENGLLFNESNDHKVTLAELCRSLAPALDVDLYAKENEDQEYGIKADDWMTIDGANLLCRVVRYENPEVRRDEQMLDEQKKIASNLRMLKNDMGEVVGRACIIPHSWEFRRDYDLSGVVAVGGLEACKLSGVSGIMLGKPLRASRDDAEPLISLEEMQRWAIEQIPLIMSLYADDPSAQADCAHTVHLCGVDTGKLPVAKYHDAWLSVADIVEKVKTLTSVILVSEYSVAKELKLLESFKLNNNVFILDINSVPTLVNNRGRYWNRWPKAPVHKHETYSFLMMTMAGALLQAVAAAWTVQIDDLLAGIGTEDNDVVVGWHHEKPIYARGIYISKDCEKSS